MSLIFSLLLCLLGLHIKGTTAIVEATLYTEVGQQGDSYYTRDYMKDITTYGFSTAISSVCVTGIWMFYENDDFNSGSIGELTTVMGTDICSNLDDPLLGNVLSLRQVGSPIVPDRPSLTLYEYSNYEGGEVYLTKTMSNLGLLRDQAYSAIVTGSSSWTVYTYEDFQGSGTCLVPTELVNIDGEDVSVGFFPTYEELGSSGSIRSVKLGCD